MENAAGRFYVDSSCIDCGACRQIAPAVFSHSKSGESSYVAAQPSSATAVERALMAVVACPTGSIGTTPKLNARRAVASFPEHVEDDVYYCGFHSVASYGAASYLVVRPNGNVLVDSPRWSAPLVDRVAARGGLRWLFLSHRDDVADHERFAARFGCTRVLHAGDAEGPLAAVERLIEGDQPVALDDDLTVIPVPGHTRGSCALLYREKYLFTGDHLFWSDSVSRLVAVRSVCWYSWADQLRSLERLLDYRFEWVLPGHGHRFHAESPEAMHEELRRTIAFLKSR